MPSNQPSKRERHDNKHLLQRVPNGDHCRGTAFSQSLIQQKIVPENGTFETLISNALKQLSLEDREQIYHDIHGVADRIDEEPEFVAQRLNEMEEELVVKLTTKASAMNEAFQQAMSMDPNFVNNRRIHKRFVRAELFDTKRAAARMIRYCDWMRSLLGGSKLCKDINFHDLDDYDIKALKRGHTQVLPSRDRAGRVLCFYYYQQYHFETPQSLVCQFCYVSCLFIVFSHVCLLLLKM